MPPMWPVSLALAADWPRPAEAWGSRPGACSGAERSLRSACWPTAEPACVWRRCRPWGEEGGRGALALPRLRVAGGLPLALRRHLGHRRARARGWRAPVYVNTPAEAGQLALRRSLSAPGHASGGCPKLRPVGQSTARQLVGTGAYAVTNRHLTVVDVGLDADVLDARVGGEGAAGAVGAAGAAGAVDGAGGGAPPSISMRHAKVARGTADLCTAAAMDEGQLARALEALLTATTALHCDIPL